MKKGGATPWFPWQPELTAIVAKGNHHGVAGVMAVSLLTTSATPTV